MKKSIKSVMAFALATSMVASTFAPATTASAASKKANVITKATYNDGRTVKYSYNGKGLVTKSISTSSSKDNDSDSSKTITTTYKYNKKNKISSKTVKTVEKETTYDTDKTTGLVLGASEGTVTTTTTAVTNFTYDKKGRATESVTTTTTGKSGSTTYTSKSKGIGGGNYDYDDDYEGDRGKEIDINGTRVFIAGYNQYMADGTYISDNTSANAYYYEGDIAATESTYTSTTTYTDKGNGVYNETTTTSNTSAGYKTEPVNLYYGRYYVNGVETITPLTYNKDGFEKEVEVITGSKYNEETNSYEDIKEKQKRTYYYQTPDGKDFDELGGSTFSITQKVTITPDPTSTNTSSSTYSTDNTGKSVTTTKYTYDKKKRVKKAVATTVNTSEEVNNSSSTRSSSSGSEYSTTSTKTDYTDKNKKTSESTEVTTTTYSYDKKGRAKKKVTSNDGIANSTVITYGGFSDSYSDYNNPFFNGDYYNYEENNNYASHNTYNYERTTTYKEGNVDTFKKSYNFNEVVNDVYPTVTTTKCENGTKTTTVTNNAYTITFSGAKSNSSRTMTTNGTTTSTSYGNGGHKTETSFTTGTTYVQNTDSNNTKAGTNTYYAFDKDGKAHGSVYVGTTTYQSGTPSQSSSASYTADGKTYTYDVAATVSIDSAKAALEASGAVYNDVDTKTLLATPSKSTTTYKYDKAGNVKSAKKSGTETKIVPVKDEVYGNTIFEWNAKGKLVVKETAVTHKLTDNDAMDNTVKKGTKVLTKKITANKYSYDRSSSSESYLSRALYTIKGKKASAAKAAKKQQWIIQNGALNGAVGLN